MVLYSSAFLFNRNIHCPKLIYFQFITKTNLEPGTEHLLKLSDQFLIVGAAINLAGLETLENNLSIVVKFT